jgi:SPW repeat
MVAMYRRLTVNKAPAEFNREIHRNGSREPKVRIDTNYLQLRKEVNMNEQRVSVPEQTRGGNSWVNILLGIWAIASPFVLAFHSSKAVWSNVITGAVVGILAIIR